MAISVVILSYESQEVLEETIQKASEVSDDIHVVDSYSTDNSVQIAKDCGAKVVQREFKHYGEQRNWAIANLELEHEWQLHLDADERLSDELIREINNLKPNLSTEIVGYHISRTTVFLGKKLLHGGFSPIYHMRLFHGLKGHCEDRLYDQHFYVDGKSAILKGELLDEMQMNIADWSRRHIRWASLEAVELLDGETEGRIAGSISGNPVEKKRSLRKFYNGLPLFIRPFLFFFYRYILRLGFLDGFPGLVYCVLQTFWFRFLIDSMIFEAKLTKKKA